MQRYINYFYEKQIVKSKTRFVYRLPIIKILKILIIKTIKMSLTIACLSLLDPINVVFLARTCLRIVAFYISQNAISDADVFRVVDAEVT